MYDTINFWLDAKQIQSTNYLLTIPKNLTGVTEVFCHKTNQHRVNGNLENYRVSVNEFGVSFYGSMPKFLFGSNCSQFANRKNYQNGIERISNMLNIEVNKSKIIRLDFGQNLSMDNFCFEYYPLLLSYPYTSRIEHLNTLYFRNGCKELAFYDKGLELQRNLFPKKETQLLRYEYKAKKNPHLLFGIEKLNAEMLGCEKIYKSILNSWYMAYKNVVKGRNSKPVPVFNNAKEFKDALALIALGENETDYLQLIAAKQKQGVINKVDAFRCKKMIRELQNGNRIVFADNSLIDELNNKMENSFLNCLESI